MDCGECIGPTLCDLEAEIKCKTELKSLLTQVIKFVDELKAFMELEKPVLDKMWKLSIKVRLLSAESPKCYPADVAGAIMQEVVYQLNNLINVHGTKLNDCEMELSTFQKRYRSFVGAAYNLDWDADLKIFKGNEYQRPLTYYIDIGDQIFKESKLILLNLRAYFDVLEMKNCLTFEDYKKCFIIAEDFLNLLNEFVVYCDIYLKYT